MKLLWILCLCFVSFHQCVKADDETTSDTSLPPTQGSSTLSDDVSTVSEKSTATSASAAETSTESTESSSASSTASETTEDTTPIADSSTSISEPSSEPTIVEAVQELNNTTLINNFSNQIRKIISHFQQPNPVGLPGQSILPDPLPAPNVSEGLGIIGSSEFYNVTVHGLSNFTIDSVNMYLDQMEVYVKIQIKNLLILGNCTYSNIFLTSKGPFRMTLTNVTAEGVVSLVVAADGALRANRSVTKLTYKDLAFHMGTNNQSNALSSFVDTAGLTVISSLQPFIQSRIDDRLTAEVNKQLKISPKFPAISKISPVDLAIMEGRQYVSGKYDPYVLPKVISYDTEFLTLNVGPVTLHGLSKFARVGDVSVGMANKTMVMKLRMVTGALQGDCKFYFNFGKVPQAPGRNRQTKFSASHLQFEATILQPMNFTQKPRLEDLQLEVGAVNVQLDGQGNFDYLVELAIRLLPDLIRHLLVDHLEEPIKRKIQEDILDHIDVDELVSKNLSIFERILQDNHL